LPYERQLDQRVCGAPRFRPTRTEWIAVDEANAATGRIQINASGEAFVQDDRDHSGAADVFTSLAGVSYTLPY
jgi:hypothetical protein